MLKPAKARSSVAWSFPLWTRETNQHRFAQHRAAQGLQLAAASPLTDVVRSGRVLRTSSGAELDDRYPHLPRSALSESFAGVPLEVDAWNCDVVYSGTQKCLSVPPGLAPITFSEKAEAVMDARTSPVRSWYLDVSAVRRYWGEERIYHHTAPISHVVGLHEGLRRVLTEGLEARWARHAEVGALFQEHIQDRNTTLIAQEGHRLPQLTTFSWPEGVDEAKLRTRLLEEYGIEVGGGLGEFKGTAWRVVLMGDGATHETVDRLLHAVDELLEG